MDQAKLEAFVGKVVADMATSMSAVTMDLGHKLGLYKAMAGAGPLTPAQLAEKTGCHERYVLEWLNNQVAGDMITYDAAAKTYSLSEEQAMVLAVEESPVFLAPVGDVVSAMWRSVDKLAERIKTGKGFGWHEHDERLFTGTEAFFRTPYRANLVQAWIPALDGVQDKLENGAKVADIGCGHGATTILMAAAFPSSRFHGYDYHDKSVAAARERAKEAGVDDRVTFEVASAKNFPGNEYDLVCFFDCFHDLGDPTGAAKHAHSALKADGTMMLVEPIAGEQVEENKHPVGRMFYAASTTICCPNSLSQEVGTALGAQAGEGRLTSVLKEASFSQVRRATQTPFNMILEARR